MPGLLRGVARTAVVAGTASAVSGRVRRRQDRRWGAEDAQQQPAPPQPAPVAYAPAPPAPPAPPAANGGDATIARLQQLAELKSQGVLTPEEFAQQKARVLAG